MIFIVTRWLVGSPDYPLLHSSYFLSKVTWLLNSKLTTRYPKSKNFRPCREPDFGFTNKKRSIWPSTNCFAWLSKNWVKTKIPLMPSWVCLIPILNCRLFAYSILVVNYINLTIIVQAFNICIINGLRGHGQGEIRSFQRRSSRWDTSLSFRIELGTLTLVSHRLDYRRWFPIQLVTRLFTQESTLPRGWLLRKHLCFLFMRGQLSYMLSWSTLF